MKRIAGRRALKQVFVSNILLSISGVISGFVLVRTLGPRGRGDLASIQSLPTLAAGLLVLGLHEAVVYTSIETPDRSRNLLSAAMRISLLVASGAALAIGAAYVLLGRPWASIAYLLFIPILSLLQIPQYALQASGSFAKWSVTRGLTSILWTLIAVSTAMRVFRHPAFVSTAYLVGLAVMVPFFFRWAVQSTSGTFEVLPGDKRRLLRYGLPLSLTAAPLALNLRLDVVVVAASFSSHDAGIYVAAVAWGTAITPMFATLATVAMPVVTQRLQTGEADVSRRVLLGAGALALVTVALSYPVTRVLFPLLFGPDYKSAVRLAALALVANTVQGFKDTAAAVVRAHGRVRVPLIGEFVALAVTLGLLWPFLHWMGLVGGQEVSLVAYALSLMVLWVAWRFDRRGLTLRDPESLP